MGPPDQQPIKRILGKKEKDPAKIIDPHVSEERIAFFPTKNPVGNHSEGSFSLQKPFQSQYRHGKMDFRIHSKVRNCKSSIDQVKDSE